MQTSQTFNQVHWPQAGDTDDCWVVSSIQAVNVVAPWLALPTVREFRKAAGDPDDGKNDGGNVAEIVEGISSCWPSLAGTLHPLRQAPWASFVARLAEGRPVTVATKSSDLPQRLQYGFGGLHQVTVVRKPNGTYLFANPLAPVYSAWDRLNSIDELRAAVMNYGAIKCGQKSVWGVALPNEEEAMRTSPLFRSMVKAAAEAMAGPLVEEARKAGYADARQKAVEAVQAI